MEVYMPLVKPEPSWGYQVCNSLYRLIPNQVWGSSGMIWTKIAVELPADQPLGDTRNPTLTMTWLIPGASRPVGLTTRVAVAVSPDLKVRHGGFTTAKGPRVVEGETLALRSRCPHQAEPHRVVSENPFRLVMVITA